MGFPAFWFVSIAFYLSLSTTEEGLTQTSLFFSPLSRYLHKLIRTPKPSLLQVGESQLSHLLPIEQMLHSPIFFLDFFVQLASAHPYLSCTGEPRDVALSGLSREEGPFQLLATLLMQPRRLLALLATRTPRWLLFHPVSTDMHRCLSAELLSSWSALSPS